MDTGNSMKVWLGNKLTLVHVNAITPVVDKTAHGGAVDYNEYKALDDR